MLAPSTAPIAAGNGNAPDATNAMMAVVDNDDETSEEECSYEAEEN
jgi:hypothetical protein